jgi:hypothetical protein
MLPTKEELIKRLRNDPMYVTALKMARTDEERKKIIATTEGFLANFIDSLSPVFKQVSNDKNLTSHLQKVLNHNEQVVKESDGKNVVSGSNS